MTVEDLKKENTELKTIIEKMKNFENCQTWNEWQCPCDKWKMKVVR